LFLVKNCSKIVRCMCLPSVLFHQGPFTQLHRYYSVSFMVRKMNERPEYSTAESTAAFRTTTVPVYNFRAPSCTPKSVLWNRAKSSGTHRHHANVYTGIWKWLSYSASVHKSHGIYEKFRLIFGRLLMFSRGARRRLLV
jgi:hypothetical protein